MRTSLVSCPNCGKRAVRLGDGEPVCSKCKWTASFTDAADAYARSGDPDWKHPKHGPDDEVGHCEDCDWDAVVPIRDVDMTGVVQQKVGALWRALKLEPGAGDAGFSVCFYCGNVHYGLPKGEDS